MTNQNIYVEILTNQEDISEAWNTLLNLKEFKSLFAQYPNQFEEGLRGELRWRKYNLFKLFSNYEVESYKKDMNLLLKISAQECNSFLLLTTEKNQDGILIRIDHRGFHGKKSKYFQRFFARRWRKIGKILECKNKNH